MTARRALITGISGQDGSYLAELLVDKGYDVTGVVRDPGAEEHPEETLTAYAGTIYFKNADFPYASTIALFTLILVVVTSSLFIKIFKVKF